MTGESIEIIISDDGISFEMKGYKNGACLNDLEKIQKLLKDGGIKTEITDQKLKPERWNTESTGVKHAIRR